MDLEALTFSACRVFYAPKGICVNICKHRNWFQLWQVDNLINKIQFPAINKYYPKHYRARKNLSLLHAGLQIEQNIFRGNLQRQKASKGLCIWDRILDLGNMDCSDTWRTYTYPFVQNCGAGCLSAERNTSSNYSSAERLLAAGAEWAEWWLEQLAWQQQRCL